MEVFYNPRFNPSECSACGTIFVADANDNIVVVAPDYDYSARGLMINCPTCGEMCTVSVYDPSEAWNDIEDDNPPKRSMFVAKSLDDSKIYFCDSHDNNGTAITLPDGELIRFRKWVTFN